MASLLPLVLSTPAFADDPNLAIHGLLQTWGTVVDQDVDPDADPAGYGDPEDDPGMSLHRARLGLDGQTGSVDFGIELGIAEAYDALGTDAGQFGPTRAEIGWRPVDALRLAAGFLDVPFSRESQFATADLLFQERSVGAQWLSPYRDGGLLGDLELPIGLRLRAGLFNGNGIFGDENTGKSVVGRLEYAKGDSYRTFSGSQDTAFGVGAAVLADTGVAVNTMSIDVDALLRVSGLAVLVEAQHQQQKPRDVDVAPPDILDGVGRNALTAQVSWFQPVGDGDGEGIEAGARFGWFDSDTRQKDNGDVAILHIGATWRSVVPWVDVGLAAIHRQELGGTGVPNDTIRATAQVRPRLDLRNGSVGVIAAPGETWASAFVGNWIAGAELDGASVSLWEQPGMGLVGSFRMDKPKGTVVVGRPYPLDSIAYADRVLKVRLDPYGENRDIVWFEFVPSPEGTLCGYGYEDGRRAEAVGGTGGGSYICWERKEVVAKRNEGATSDGGAEVGP